MHIKNMSCREIIKTEVDEGDFLKSILHVVEFTRQFKCIINAGDLRPILGNWNVWPGI